MSDLFGNQDDRFSRDGAYIKALYIVRSSSTPQNFNAHARVMHGCFFIVCIILNKTLN